MWWFFTTFSTFSLETAELIKGGSVLTAVIYVIFSIVVGVLAVMLPQLGAEIIVLSIVYCSSPKFEVGYCIFCSTLLFIAVLTQA